MPEAREHKNKKYPWRGVLCFFAAFACGASVAVIYNYFTNALPSTAPDLDMRLGEGHYTYINPLLECNIGADISNELQTFKKELQGRIDAAIAQKSIDSASVYFRDMNNGPWFGLNETQEFYPASLLKVPIMMAYYKASEASSTLLADRILFAKKINPHTEYFASNTIMLGRTYTVGELISAMITHSDNDAMDLLVTNASALGVDASDALDALNVNLGSDGMITVRQYATFFRILFNSSYLDYDDSEKALGLLAQSSFTQGLQAGVPSTVNVAHKFGEQWSFTNPEKELHDCGIVYYPNHPYLLCIMTQGTDFNLMANTIADISRYVYSQVDNQLGR
ncbi:MAG: serine hydrolase [Patescibacteria group bacterium]|nr:serine hydrolase [Patescibacteria group bacterium]